MANFSISAVVLLHCVSLPGASPEMGLQGQGSGGGLFLCRPPPPLPSHPGLPALTLPFPCPTQICGSPSWLIPYSPPCTLYLQTPGPRRRNFQSSLNFVSKLDVVHLIVIWHPPNYRCYNKRGVRQGKRDKASCTTPEVQLLNVSAHLWVLSCQGQG